MTEQQHPITPPQELIDQWFKSCPYAAVAPWIATQAARWGYEQRVAANEKELQKARDEQLDQCCDWLDAWEAYEGQGAVKMSEDLRPKPPSLAEEASKALTHILRHSSTELGSDTIRSALERLQEHEQQVEAQVNG